jgi:hypothetical protein
MASDIFPKEVVSSVVRIGGMTALKDKLHSLIEATNNEALLEDLLIEAESRLNTNNKYGGRRPFKRRP